MRDQSINQSAEINEDKQIHLKEKTNNPSTSGPGLPIQGMTRHW
jgi:hypothetical protein